jgi:hypothetical protein
MGRNTPAIILFLVPSNLEAKGAGSAEIVDWGRDKEVYFAGDRPAAFVEIKNTGDQVVEDATVKLTAAKKNTHGEYPFDLGQGIQSLGIRPGLPGPAGKKPEIRGVAFPDPRFQPGERYL